MEENIPEPKAELVCMCVKEMKIRNVNLPFKKDFKFTELLTKTTFSFTLETVLKMAKETN